MTISVFTPTHDPRYLPETYDSLKIQDCGDFEWVIVPNGKCVLADIPGEISKDKRVRIVPFEGKMDGKPRIGLLKKFACDQCKGDLFVELDHDDMLMPGVLAELLRLQKEGAGFIFSDTVNFVSGVHGPEPFTFDAAYGWETYEVRIFGRELRAMRNFETTPRSLCEIYFAPDHVRAWTRAAYYRAGGHDVELGLGDDHDLVCRTYLAGIPFGHLKSAGYIYRRHSHGASQQYNADIVAQSLKTRQKYLHRLITEWIRRESVRFINLWPGGPPAKGFRINAEDSSIGCIRAYGVLHKIPREKLPRVMNEIYRVLMPGGWLCTLTPSTSGPEAFTPIAASWWNALSFDFFCHRDKARLLKGYTGRFQLVQVFEDFPCKDLSITRSPWICADMVCLKGQRTPGRMFI